MGAPHVRDRSRADFRCLVYQRGRDHELHKQFLQLDSGRVLMVDLYVLTFTYQHTRSPQLVGLSRTYVRDPSVGVAHLVEQMNLTVTHDLLFAGQT